MRLDFLITLLMISFISAVSYCQNGLTAEYYNGINFEEYVGSGTVSDLDFYWEHDPPIEGLNRLYNIATGQLVKTFELKLNSGMNQVVLDISDIPTGFYYLRNSDGIGQNLLID